MSLPEFLLLVFACNAVALGNGPVMVPLLRRGLVEESGVLSLDQLLYAFAVAQVTPGQANLFVAPVGYMLYGLAGGLLATLAIVVPGYSVLPLAYWYERFRRFGVVRRFTRGLTAASVGLIFAAVLAIGQQSLTGAAGWVVFLTTLGLAHILRWNAFWSVLAASAIGLGLLHVPTAANLRISAHPESSSIGPEQLPHNRVHRPRQRRPDQRPGQRVTQEPEDRVPRRTLGARSGYGRQRPCMCSHGVPTSASATGGSTRATRPSPSGNGSRAGGSPSSKRPSSAPAANIARAPPTAAAGATGSPSRGASARG